MSRFDYLAHDVDVLHFENGGINIDIKSNIGYSEKQELALQLLSSTVLTQEESKLMYISYKKPLIECMLVIKHYTNFDMTNCETEDDWIAIFDWAMTTGFYKLMYDYVRNDLDVVLQIMHIMTQSMILQYNKENSLSTAVQKSFGFLFTDESIVDVLAKSQVLNNQMIDMLDAVQKRDEEQKKTTRTKKDKVRVGNTMVNIAKKS